MQDERYRITIIYLTDQENHPRIISYIILHNIRKY